MGQPYQCVNGSGISAPSIQLDSNSLIWSRHYGPETNTSALWSGQTSTNARFESATYGEVTWVDQGANAPIYGVSVQPFVTPAGCTSITAGFSYVETGAQTPATVTWGISTGSGWAATTTITPTASLQATSLTVTVTANTRYYFVVESNANAGSDGGLQQAPFFLVNSYVTPNNATTGTVFASGFQRMRVDASSYRRSTSPSLWDPAGYEQQASPFSYVEFVTNATSMSLEVYENLAYISTGFRIDVNGTFNQYVYSGTSGASILPVTLPSGQKLIRITISSQAELTPGAFTGSWLRAIYVPSTATLTAPPRATVPTRRVLFYGDSITVATTGGFSEGTSIGDQSAPNLVGDTGLIEPVFAAYGGLALADNCSTQAACDAMVLGWPADVTDIWLTMGANDYLRPTVNATTFGTYYSYLIKSIQAYIPGAHLYLETPLPELSEAANGFGSTLGNYRTAIANLKTSCTCAFIDSTAIGFSTSTMLIGDGIHPNQEGHGVWATAIEAALTGGTWNYSGFNTVPAGGSTDQVLTWISGTPTWNTGIDSTGALPIGGTSATSVTIGNLANTTVCNIDSYNVSFAGTAGSTETIGFASAAATGAATLQIVGQSANGSNPSGDVVITSGFSGLDGGGEYGNVWLATGGTSINSVELSGRLLGELVFNNAPVLTESEAASGTSASDFMIIPQAPNPSSTGSAANASNIILATPAPVGTGSYGMTEFASGDTVFAAIGTGATNYLWLGQSFPNSSNYLFASGSSSTYILGTTYLQLAANNGESGTINLSSTAITESIAATQIALGNTSGWTLSPGGTAAAGTATAAAAQYVWNPATTIVAGGSQQNKINRYVWNTYSSNSVANTVGTITPSNGQGILVHGYNIGRLHSSPYTAYASECAAAFSEASGSVSQAGTATVLATFGSGSTCGISASGGSIYPTVTGGTTSQIDWTTIADVIQE